MFALESLRGLPKVQLHCHLEGTVRTQTFMELASRYGVSTTYRPAGFEPTEPADHATSVYAFRDFQEFLFTFAAVCRSLQSPADYARILREYAEDASRNNVIYAELHVSPAVWQFFHVELALEEAFEHLHAAAQEIEAQKGLLIRFICDLTRNFGVESAMETVRFALRMQKYGVIAIGLGGDEAKFPARLFEQPFAHARAYGLHAVAHAGEAAGAQSVHDAVTILRAERIGHGIRALESPGALDLLRSRDVTLEICPTSNFATGVVPRAAAHPFLELDRAGISLVIDCDDPALFASDITTEYEYVAAAAGLDAALRFARRAVVASFAPAPAKVAMAARVERASAELLASRRS